MRGMVVNKIVFIVCFALMISVPTVLINTKSGVISEEEKRDLNDFPVPAEYKADDILWFRNHFVAALQDRIGFRTEFVRTAGAAKLYALRLSPSSQVRMGKDGWYFYTKEKNIEIGMGTYKYPDEFLSEVAENQQALSDYYKKKGVPYFFVPTPSKSSVYPEYLPGDYHVRQTVIDQVTETLQSRTDVKVVMVKDHLVNNKDKGRLFFKQDTHWNTLGPYFAYGRVLEEMNRAGVLDGAQPIGVELQEKNFGSGEFSNYFGGILPDEYALDTVWAPSARKIEDGELYDRIYAICEAGYIHGERQLTYNLSMYENPGAEGGTLLIYGDSMTDSRLKFPLYFSEHFRFVVNVGRLPNIYEPLEDELKPDVVLWQRTERYLDVLFYDPPGGQ